MKLSQINGYFRKIELYPLLYHTSTIRDINLDRIIGNHKIYHSESFLGTWNIYVPGQLRAKSSNVSISEQISAWFATFRFFVPWMSLDLLKVEMRYKILQELLSLKSSRVLAENLRTRFFSDMRFSQDDGGHPFLSFSTVCSQKIFSFVWLEAFCGPQRRDCIYLKKSGIFERLWTT